jgi:pyruvate,water dikinase
VLAVAGGVVTEEGGPLSHAAVIARELGLPALIGSAGATSLIVDGASIELDPVAGTVRVLTAT